MWFPLIFTDKKHRTYPGRKVEQRYLKLVLKLY